MRTTLPCRGCRGLCCGPVPITSQELVKIKKGIKRMTLKDRLALEQQHRFFGTCIFYDLKNDKCGIHPIRPSICRVFGHYENLICFREPGAASTKKWAAKDDPAGVLSVDFTWKDF